ncbi:16S rRNA (cytosine(967)-C(5))-methyltransferase RsmB [Alkalicoccus chagannorensis]|uniref:16S rRNA (cytosine(967)-C(5))-methyltransferase RsmB n=1 Tax=Alkalicoccus chagannorensis TaxID=427072 RepID=UPI00041BC875|nr:16S rRNA (cytosine(967)-C(5))-methyltransferase RsmB [Alkalicoccus chagannorensis]
MTDVREAALDALIKIEKNQAYSNLLLDQVMKNKNIPARDKGLLTQLVYGTLQHRRRLDHEIAALSKKPLDKLDDWVVVLLRMSMFQLLFLDRVPDHAAVDEAVTIAKKRSHKGTSGFVNGLLRAFLRGGETGVPQNVDPVTRIGIEHSHPDWMIRRWMHQYGEKTAEAVAAGNNTPPHTAVRTQLTRITRGELQERLSQEGVESTPSPLLPDALRIQRGSAAGTKAFEEGLFSIQDEGSMLIGRLLSPHPGERILDACAAPGGKTVHIASLAPEASITALDLHPHKTSLIAEQAQRLGLPHIRVQTGDARKEQWEEPFDRILVDAPCSGLGVLQRKPDMKWTKQEEDIDRLQKIQADILDHVWTQLAPGGTLLYSTCTIEAEENERQILAFVERHEDASAGALPMEEIPAAVHADVQDGWMLQLIPGRYDTDGFFAAAVQKSR